MSPELKVGFNRPHTEYELRIIRQFWQEYADWRELIRAEFNTQYAEDFSGMAFNVGLTPEEMRGEISSDPERFKNIYGIAISEVIEYQEAAKKYEADSARGQILLDKIGRTYNRKRRYYPKPEKMYEQGKPRGRRKTKAQVVARAQGFIRWRNAHNALNVEPGTPLDEFPDIFKPWE